MEMYIYITVLTYLIFCHFLVVRDLSLKVLF